MQKPYKSANFEYILNIFLIHVYKTEGTSQFDRVYAIFEYAKCRVQDFKTDECIFLSRECEFKW